jgi:hypothetical protein
MWIESFDQAVEFQRKFATKRVPGAASQARLLEDQIVGYSVHETAV